jgi:hypothetical protein
MRSEEAVGDVVMRCSDAVCGMRCSDEIGGVVCVEE